MLVLSRRANEKILIPSLDVSVQVVSINKNAVRLGIEAPAHVQILREELHARQAEWSAPPRPAVVAAPVSTPAAVAPADDPAAAARLQRLTQLLGNRLKVMGTGMAMLRRQLAEGNASAIADTLEALHDDVQLLRRRLEDEEKKGQRQNPGGRHRALLVEDNDNERELLASFLRLEGLDVVTAHDGTDALDYLSHHRDQAEVVLLDMSMPRCDGATMVRALRCDPAYSRLKIFAVSGHTPEEYGLARGPQGVDRWFHKPINPHDLVNDVNRELDGQGARSEPTPR